MNWEKFKRDHWDARRPTVIRGAGGRFTDEMVLAGLRAFPEGNARDAENFRFMLSLGEGKRPAPAKLKQVLGAESPTMEALEEKIERAFPELPFGLMINNFQSLDPALWRGVTKFLHEAHAYIDFPIARAIVDLFYGNYAASFLGLHKDTQDIFAFVPRGKKKMLFWPFEYFIARVPGMSAAARYFQVQVPVDYRKYKKDALVLEAEAGDVIYWPSEYWHIAEGRRGEFATMLSLGLFRPDVVDPNQAIELNRFRERVRGGAGDVSDVNREGGDRRLTWMTGYSFSVGAPVTKNVRRGVELSKPAGARLLWTVEDQRITVSCNGHLKRFPRDAATVALLEKAARGERLVGETGPVLNWLARVRAVC